MLSVKTRTKKDKRTTDNQNGYGVIQAEILAQKCIRISFPFLLLCLLSGR